MSSRSTTQSIAERGEQVVEQSIRPLVADPDPFDFVAIDVETGAFEVDADSQLATDCLQRRLPNAVIYGRTVGFPVAVWLDGTRPNLGRQRWRTQSSEVPG